MPLDSAIELEVSEAAAPDPDCDVVIAIATHQQSSIDLIESLPMIVPLVMIVDDIQGAAVVSRLAMRGSPLAVLPSGVGDAALRAAVMAVFAGFSVGMPGAITWKATSSDALASAERNNDAPRRPGQTHSVTAEHGVEDVPLTPRELEVFELMAKGLSNREIGAVLDISSHTAKFHISQILEKTGSATRAEAVGHGLRRGLIGL